MAQVTNGREQLSLQRLDYAPTRRGTKVNASVQQLLRAARDGREDVVRKWLQTCPESKKKNLLDLKDKHGCAAVHYAARFNRFKILNLLLLDEANPELPTEEGLTPLHYAARYVPLVQGDTDENPSTPTDSEGSIAAITLASSSQQMVMLLVNHYSVNVTVVDSFGYTPLHYASSRGNRAAVEILLASGKVDVNVTDKQQNTPLHAACRNGDPWIVEKLLDAQANVLHGNEEGVNPLHVACQEGLHDIVKMIMLKRPDKHDQLVRRVDNERNTPLHLACGSGEVEIVRVLLLYMADPIALKIYDVSPLHIAAREGYTDIANMLLQYEQTKLDTADDDSETPLHYAVKHSQDGMIRFLLDKKADIESQDVNSYTPLLTAVAQGQKVSMEVLLERDAASDVFDRDGKSIVYLAAQNNHVAILESLIVGKYHYIGARLSQTSDTANNTPLHIAARKGHVEAVKILLRAKKVRADAPNRFGKTPMHLAAETGYTKVVKELIRHNRILIHDEDDDSNTPLHIACIHGHYDVTKLLLDNKSDPDARNLISWTPLDCAAQNGWSKVIELLIDAGADLEPLDTDHVTPLLLACQEGHLSVVELLMSQGARVSRTNNDGLNSLDIAIENGHKDVVLAIIMSDQWKSALRNRMTLPNGKETTPTRRLIKKMPALAEVMFTRCVTTNEKDGVSKDDKDFKVTFNYEFLEDDRDPKHYLLGRSFTKTFSRNVGVRNSDKEMGHKGSGDPESLAHLFKDSPEDQWKIGKGGFENKWGPEGFVKKLHPLSLLVDSKQTDLLNHSLVTSLLNYKWVHYGQYVYLANILIYLLFLAFITTFALVVPAPNSSICRAASNYRNLSSLMLLPTNDSLEEVCSAEGLDVHRRRYLYISSVLTIIFAAIKLIFEGFQLLKLRYRYLLDWVNYLELILFSFSIIFAFVIPDECLCPTDWQYQLGAIAVFLSWISLIIIVRKLPFIGIYVVMFIDIFYTFWKMALLAILLILSFSFSFYMLFNDPTTTNGRFPFMDIWRAVIKTMTMTTGEYEFDTTFRQCGEECPNELQYPAVSFILWIAFIILMPILLTNLLVGLAVDDIKGIQQAAVLKRLALRVELTLSVEELLPKYIRRRLIIGRRTVYPNRKLHLGEKLWYNVFKAVRFDSIENITNTLNPPLEPVEEVQEQNNKLALKVASMQDTINNMASTQESLISLMRALTKHNGIEVDETDGTFKKIRSTSRPPTPPLSPAPRCRSPVRKTASPSPELSVRKPFDPTESIDLSDIVKL